jgi:Meiosis protein SPO22/ZIP4 like
MALVRPAVLLWNEASDSYQSWQQDRLDLAEHFFDTMDFAQVRSTPAAMENMVDLLFEMGSSLLHKGCYDMAVVWLKRASELLQHQDLEGLSPDAGELKMKLLHTYGQLCSARIAMLTLADASLQKSPCSLLLGICRSSSGSQ